MKWVRFEHKGRVQFGVFQGQTITSTPRTWSDILAGEKPDSGEEIALNDAKLLAPVERPGKIIAIGLNYMDHCREQNIAPPTRPIIFTKFTTSIIGPTDTIMWSTDLTQQVDFEVELAVIIGKTTRKISEIHALSSVFGYTVANDVSARDLQFGDQQWVRGKSLDTFCPLGPVVITADEIPNPQALSLRCTLNNQIVQDSTTAEMIFSVKQLIAFCSNAFTLEPGDLILTGTPHGVGVFREPKLFMQNGDRVIAEIDGIGRLENLCQTI